MDAPHAAGAITNPDAYRQPTKKSAAPESHSGAAAAASKKATAPAASKFAFAGSLGNPTRKFNSAAAPPPPQW